MNDKEVRINIRSTADSKGAKETKKSLQEIQDAVTGAGMSVDKLEKELKNAEKVLANTNKGSKSFKALQAQIVRTRELLRTIRIGNVDSKGLERLQQQLARLRERTERARASLSRPPRAGWITSLTTQLGGLANAIPGGGRVTAFLGSFTRGSGAAVAAVGGVIAAVTGLIGITKQGLGNIAVIEDLEASFTTLLGSVELAESKIQTIRQIAAETPISVGDLATVARQLTSVSIAGKTAEETLRLVGDAAAATARPNISLGQSAQELAVHYRRVVNALKAGAGEIGESTNRFDELGVVSRDVVEQLRAMHKEGGRGQEAIALLNGEMEKFSGEMVRRSKTISGATNNLGDAWDRLSATVAAPFAPGYKKSLQGLTDRLGSAADFIENVSSKIRVFFGGQSLAAEQASLSITQSMADAADSVGTVADATQAGTASAKASLTDLSSSFEGAADSAKKLLDQQNKLASAELQLELARIEDSDLSDSEKTRASAEARIRAEAEKTSRELDVIREGIAGEREATEAIRDEIELLTSRRALAEVNLANTPEPSQGLIDYTKELKVRLEEATGQLNEFLLVNLQAQDLPGFLPQDPLPFSPGEIAAATAEVTKAQEALVAREKEINDIAKNRRTLAIAIAESSSALVEHEKALAKQESQSRVNISTAEKEIATIERLAAVQQKTATRRANTDLRKQTQSEVKEGGNDEAKGIEKAIKDAEKSRADQAKGIAKELEGLNDLTEKDFGPRIEAAIQDLEQGDLRESIILASSAAKTRISQDLKDAGGDLLVLLDQYKSTTAEIDKERVRLLAAQTRARQDLDQANKVEITVPPVRETSVEERVTRIFEGDLPPIPDASLRVIPVVDEIPNPNPTVRPVTDELTSDLPTPEATTRNVTDASQGDLPNPEAVSRAVIDVVDALRDIPAPVDRRVDDVTGRPAAPPEPVDQIIEQVATALGDPESARQEVVQIASRLELPRAAEQAFQKLILTLPESKGVGEKALERESRPTPSSKESNDVPARILTDKQSPGRLTAEDIRALIPKPDDSEAREVVERSREENRSLTAEDIRALMDSRASSPERDVVERGAAQPITPKLPKDQGEPVKVEVAETVATPQPITSETPQQPQSTNQQLPSGQLDEQAQQEPTKPTPVVIEKPGSDTLPNSAPADASSLDVEPVVSAAQNNSNELKKGLSRIVTAQEAGTQGVVSAMDATANALGEATNTIVNKLTDVQDRVSTLESQVKNAR